MLPAGLPGAASHEYAATTSSSFSSTSTTRTSSSGGRSRVRGDDRVPARERPDRDALELEHRVVGEALAERLPVAVPDAEVVPRDVLVEEVESPGGRPRSSRTSA